MWHGVPNLTIILFLTRPELGSNTHWAIATLFELVGLQYAKDGPKAPPFSEIFS